MQCGEGMRTVTGERPDGLDDLYQSVAAPPCGHQRITPTSWTAHAAGRLLRAVRQACPCHCHDMVLTCSRHAAIPHWHPGRKGPNPSQGLSLIPA